MGVALSGVGQSSTWSSYLQRRVGGASAQCCALIDSTCHGSLPARGQKRARVHHGHVDRRRRADVCSSSFIRHTRLGWGRDWTAGNMHTTSRPRRGRGNSSANGLPKAAGRAAVNVTRLSASTQCPAGAPVVRHGVVAFAALPTFIPVLGPQHLLDHSRTLQVHGGSGFVAEGVSEFVVQRRYSLQREDMPELEGEGLACRRNAWALEITR